MSMTTFSLASSVPTDDTNTTHSADAICDVPLCQIFGNPHQPRSYFDEDALRELATSIQQHGVLQPVLLRQIGPEQYELIAGERRTIAAELAGLTTIPAIIKTTTEREQAELALIENLQREDLSPVETARAFQTLMQQFAMTQQEIAERVGKTQSTISGLLHLLKLSDRILDGLDKGAIQERHARELLRIEDNTLREQLYSRMISEKLSVRETAALVRDAQGAENNPGKAPALHVPSSVPEPVQAQTSDTRLIETNTTRLALQLTNKFGRRVVVHCSDDEQGRIEIGFFDKADLRRIADMLL